MPAEQEKQLELLTENIPGGVHKCLDDENFTLLSMSKGFFELCGYTRNEIHDLLSDQYINLIYPSDRSRVRKSVMEQRKNGEAQIQLEYRMLRKDGTSIWVIDKSRLVNEGGVSSFYSILMDTTERNEKYEELRLSLDRHQVIMDQTTDIIFEWDIIEDTLLFSENWYKKFGYYAINDVITKRIPLSKNIHEEDMPCFIEIMEKTRHGDPFSETEFRIRDIKGNFKWCRIRATVQFGGDRMPIRAVGVITDVDEEKKQRQLLLDRAKKDALTGLCNKTVIQDLIESRLCFGTSSKNQVLLIIDIDDFKSINDTYGHQCGDIVLKDVADMLNQQSIFSGLTGRIGGDEFLAFIPELLDREEVSKKISMLLTKLRTIRPVETASVITCSIGAAYYYPEISDFDTLFNCADKALYYVKNHGRNNFMLFESGLCNDYLIQKNSYSLIETRVDLNAERNKYLQRGLMGERRKWFDDRHYEMVLRQAQIFAFEYNIVTGKQFVSPPASEYFVGNYDDRYLSVVMIEDGAIHPDDLDISIRFRDIVKTTPGRHEMILRLKRLDGNYCWCKMSVCLHTNEKKQKILLGSILNVDEEVALRESLRIQVEYHPISGIFSKETFFKKTKEKMLNCPNQSYNLIRFDISRFKTVNALFTAKIGDCVLQYIGTVIKSVVREGETFGHLGNDVFCLCVGRSDEETVALFEEISHEVNQYPIDFDFILSAGILHIPSYEGEPIDVLCDRAALAQKEVKGNFLRRYAFYEERMGEALNQEHYIISQMHKALDERQFVVYFQPKHNLFTGQMIGSEALVRWMHPERGLMMPGEFIPLFEQNGLIALLDEYVWEEVCRILRGWIDDGYQPQPVSINVSRAHLYGNDLCDKLLALVRKYNLLPELLEIELTESAYVENPHLKTLIRKLQSNNFTFVMDDFGSGYSSLNMLRNIPVDILKIDLNFLKFSDKDVSGKIIIECVVSMVNRLGIPVIVEGVETADQVEFLKRIGCEMAQGYYFSKPMPAKSLESRYMRREL